MAPDNNSVKNILLADDDPDDAYLFGLALKDVSKETQLTVVENGQELMQLLLSDMAQYPALIFLDVNMPRKNGIECLKEIKALEKLNGIPVIMYSTTAQEKGVNSAYVFGANYYIQKPPTFTELKNLIKKVLAINWQEEKGQSSFENFILRPDKDLYVA